MRFRLHLLSCVCNLKFTYAPYTPRCIRLINGASSLWLNEVWLLGKMVDNSLKEHAIRSNSET